MDSENILSNSDVSEIIDLAEKAIVNEYLSESEKEWTILKVAAQKFLNEYNDLSKQKEVQETQMIHKLMHSDPENISYIKDYESSANKHFSIKQQQYFAAFEFDKALTDFRGGLPRKAIFVVDSEGHNPTSFELSLEELVQLANKRGRLFNISVDKINSLLKQTSKESQMIEIEHIKQAKNAYMGTMNRLDRYFEKRKKYGSKSQERNAILMWKFGKDWTLARVVNKGDVKEAYVSALFTEHKSKMDKLFYEPSGREPYFSHSLISTFFQEYITKVTNMAAIREEDVVTSVGQYAVKGEAAALPSIKQYLTLAKIVTQSQNILSREEIELKIEETFPQNAARNKIIATTNNLRDLAYKKIGLSDIEYKSIIDIS